MNLARIMMPAAAFPGLKPAPPDSILGLSGSFRADPRAGKISLAVGVYQDEAGQTPILATVGESEHRLAAKGASKTYLPVGGDTAFTESVRALIFGDAHPALRDRRVETLHTPGGTGALRVAVDLVHRLVPGATAWLSTPTWPNHPQILAATGMAVRWYPYLREGGNGLDLDGMLAALHKATRGDLVVIHACCHNPTGTDLSSHDWRRLGSIVAERGLLPLLDFAYQGFGDGLDEDAAGVRSMAAEGCTVLVASSMSKNFAIYSERVGALSIVGATRKEAESLASHALVAARATYSNPPAHGGEIVTMILRDPALRARWVDEVATMRNRIKGNRARFIEALTVAGVTGRPGAHLDAGALSDQRGMFSLLRLSPEQVARLRQDFALYVVAGGRVNVAGLTAVNLTPVCAAIAAVVGEG
jgi:aspartate/tyrosine/aromatic aminotransferase